jgi:phosphopantothenoylcysteine decarboxylase / phosphopantothenate---cysteine ligase
VTVKLPSHIRFLITAGPTREFLDPIRYISNRSSGKMGYAIAEAARAVSPQVTLVSGPTALTPPRDVEFVVVTTAQEMAEAVWSRFDSADICIMAAAVCDFRPKKVAESKMKKASFRGVLELEPTPDILAELGRRKTAQVLIGFAAETEDVDKHAREKLARKNLDLIVANDSSAFDVDTNRVALISNDGQTERLPEMRKSEVAKVIVERAARLVRRVGLV